MSADEKNTETPQDGAQENAELEGQQTADQAADPSADGDSSLEEQLEDALAEVAQIKDQMIRDQAETQNVRRRVQRDVENARKFALEKFVGELLPVIDNLERALDASEETSSFTEGVELTRKTFLDVLGKFNVVQLNPVGEPFDANFHEAMTMVPNPNMDPNTVMDVMQKGYTLNERLVRPAMVVVSKAP
ncbi:Protein GrpE [BD1-7 clade bacterium]|uniref:Protein GrpE n=1 Tax=BD1-7 clade bacterium TaxID=2029982 RepID=A0A5S9PDV3_9GAMM|nr:Protein GrpE [BD1-7 clade bacterium]